MTVVIEVREASLAFRGVVLFEAASMSIERGRTYALTGPNGSGKSVLLRLICRFAQPDAGEVWVDPGYLSRDRTFPDRFGVTIDGPAYLPGLTGLDNLLELARIQRKITKNDVRATMIRVGLDPDAKQRVRHYSLGMKQKLSLAQALMERPDVLLLDEPFNALDAKSIENTKRILREDQAAGTTILFTSHSERDVRELADHTYRIVDHKIVTVKPARSSKKDLSRGSN